MKPSWVYPPLSSAHQPACPRELSTRPCLSPSATLHATLNATRQGRTTSWLSTRSLRVKRQRSRTGPTADRVLAWFEKHSSLNFQQPTAAVRTEVLAAHTNHTMNLGGMEAIAQQVAGKAILDHAKETEKKLVRLVSRCARNSCGDSSLESGPAMLATAVIYPIYPCNSPLCARTTDKADPLHAVPSTRIPCKRKSKDLVGGCGVLITPVV